MCTEGGIKPTKACLEAELIYTSQMYRVERPYLALKLNSTFRTEVLSQCGANYEKFEQKIQKTDKLAYTLQELDVSTLFNINSWNFKKPEGCYNINGGYTYDMDLYFEIEDMRMLYDWKVKEFLKICELTSGEMADCMRNDFYHKDDYNICLEQKLSVLESFNYITEDDQARFTLYQVCKNNRISIEGGNMRHSDRFKKSFPTFEHFDHLFE